MSELLSLRVLVVEDEPFLAMEVEHMLDALGCKIVASVASIAAALSRIQASNDFDVALLDVNLRGEFVFPVAEALVERGIGFVFMTGYGRDGVRADFEAYPVVAKPFMPAELRHALEAALIRPRGDLNGVGT